jgi:long-subunit acyl-CoA synthetase (AMP-forming)
MIDIAALATSVWTMIQPHLPSLATTVTGEISKKVPEAVGKVWDAIKKKFEAKPAAKEALEDVVKTPDNQIAQEVFQLQLKKAMTEDESFASDLSKLLEAAGGSYKATLTGGGAIAQGTGAKAVGERGVMIEGGMQGGNIVTGDKNSVNDEKKKK